MVPKHSENFEKSSEFSLAIYNTEMVINTGTYSPYSYYDGYYDGYYHDYIDSDAISIPGLLAVEAFLQIGKFLKRIYR